MPTVYLKIEVEDIDPRQSLAPGTPVTLDEFVAAAGGDLDATVVASVPEPLRYLAVLHQPGGCDYTIACGTRVEHLDADAYEDAVLEAEALLEDFDDERALDDLTLYEVTRRTALDVKAGYARLEAKARAAQVAEAERKERDQLAQLTRKYGKP